MLTMRVSAILIVKTERFCKVLSRIWSYQEVVPVPRSRAQSNLKVSNTGVSHARCDVSLGNSELTRNNSRNNIVGQKKSNTVLVF